MSPLRELANREKKKERVSADGGSPLAEAEIHATGR